MEKLISRSDIAEYRQISNTPNDAKLNEMILDAQLLDVQPLLGETLYNKIMAAPGDYVELLQGGEYNHNEQTYINYGLKMVLVYFTYARYLYFASAIDTPSGFREKISPESQPVTEANKKSIYSLNRDSAFTIWENVKNYLIRTGHLDFPKCQTSASSRGMKFTKIV